MRKSQVRCYQTTDHLYFCHDFSRLRCVCNSETGSKDESGAASSLLAYGGGERGDQQPGVVVSVSLVPAKVYVSSSAKAAAEGPDDVSGSAADIPETVKGTVEGSGADATAEPDG